MHNKLFHLLYILNNGGGDHGGVIRCGTSVFEKKTKNKKKKHTHVPIKIRHDEVPLAAFIPKNHVIPLTLNSCVFFLRG